MPDHGARTEALAFGAGEVDDRDPGRALVGDEGETVVGAQGDVDGLRAGGLADAAHLGRGLSALKTSDVEHHDRVAACDEEPAALMGERQPGRALGERDGPHEDEPAALIVQDRHPAATARRPRQ